jgi:hypothetical protein
MAESVKSQAKMIRSFENADIILREYEYDSRVEKIRKTIGKIITEANKELELTIKNYGE